MHLLNGIKRFDNAGWYICNHKVYDPLDTEPASIQTTLVYPTIDMIIS